MTDYDRHATAFTRLGYIAAGARELSRIYGWTPAVSAELWPMPLESEPGVRVTVHLMDKPNIHFYEPEAGFPSDTLKAKIMLLAP